MEKGGSSWINCIFENLVTFLLRCIFYVLSVGPIPYHFAFIMDGNRRYAKKQNFMEGNGHGVGFLALLSMCKYCYELGMKYVTIYAFSIDNFKRKPEEVQSLMDLMQLKIERLIKEESVVNHYGVRVHFIGNLKLLSEPVRLAAERAMLATANNSKVVLSVCVAYTSTNEIVHAVQKSCEQKWEDISILDASGSGYGLTEVVLSEKDERENLINLIDIEKHMYMTVAPDPHTLIRTSGETKLEQFSSLADSILFLVFALRALARNWIWAFPLGNLELPAESLLFGEKKETVVNIVDSHILGL